MSFQDSKKFLAEVHTMFPHSYLKLVGLRFDLKRHHFDLLDVMKDVTNLARTTKDNLSRSVKKLKLRKKYEDKGKLKASDDVRIWEYEIKYQLSDLEKSLHGCGEIVKQLLKIQNDSARTHDNIENDLEFIKVEL